jgi:hypothetical protein
MISKQKILDHFLRDGDISWTMTSRGHFLSKWATSRGHFQKVTSRGHFLGEFWVIINSANHRGCWGEAPARLSEHCSLPG